MEGECGWVRELGERMEAEGGGVGRENKRERKGRGRVCGVDVPPMRIERASEPASRGGVM